MLTPAEFQKLSNDEKIKAIDEAADTLRKAKALLQIVQTIDHCMITTGGRVRLSFWRYRRCYISKGGDVKLRRVRWRLFVSLLDLVNLYRQYNAFLLLKETARKAEIFEDDTDL